ncbi:MAG: hypothetical protein ACOYMG_02345 [Candidatus Methylumidiphilus sp.]
MALDQQSPNPPPGPPGNAGEGQLATIQNKWLYFVKIARRLNMVPQVLDEAPIREVFAIANTATLSREELEQQERRHDFIRLQRGSQLKAYEDGQKAKQLEVAKNLLPMLDDAAIATATGLEVEVVGRLRGFRLT